MKKIFLILVYFIPFLLFSQKLYIIEGAILECQYNYTIVKDTFRRNQIKTDVYTLRIGENVSQFYNQTYQNSTSLTAAEIVKLLDNASAINDYSSLPGAKTSVDYLYKNYPEKKITTSTLLLVDPFQYEEELEPQQWVIRDSTKQILDFFCQKAECDFRGRHWTVWFTPDIPISDGPWKFSGLPGLILDAYDTNKDHSFSIISLKKNNLTPVTFYKISDKPFEKTERKTFLKAKQRIYFSDDPMRDMEAATGIDLSGGKASAPREKNNKYDFIERDYK